MKRIMAVYDVDPFYADRFAEFVNQKEQIPFTVMAFTSLEKLRSYAALQQIEILLINSAIGKEEIDLIGAGQVMVLSDGEVVPLKEDYPSIYKYQSTDCIIREVMACYCEQPVEEALTVLTGKAVLIGVYSPVNRCLKTSFSLTLGQLLAKDAKVLYVTLEEYSGLSKLTNTTYKGDLSDVLYYYRQGSFNQLRLSSVVYSWGSLDYIAPARYPEDLCQVTAKDMALLITRIARESPYEFVILDMGQFGKKALEVLEICDTIYMPVKDDSISAAKLEEFEEYIETAGKNHLKDRIQRLKLPYHSSFGRKENYVEQLLWGELGDYVRQLVKGQGYLWNH